MSSTTDDADDSAHDRSEGRGASWRRWAIVAGSMFVLGAVFALVANAMLSGPSLEVIQVHFAAATSDLDGIALAEGGGEYDLSHATGVECLREMNPGELVRLGIAHVDRSDADIPFEAELGQDQVVLWVECLPQSGADL